MKFKISILLFFLISSITSFTQKRAHYSLGLDVKIPRIISNSAFKTVMYSIADLDANFNYLITKSFSAGLDIKYAYFQINNKFFQNQINGQIELNGLGLSLFYINNTSEITYVKLGCKIGAYQLLGSLGTDPPLFKEYSYLIEPTVGVYLNNSSFGSVGLLFSYCFWNSSFRPEMIGMTQISGLNSSNFNALNRVFCVGLSYEKVFGYK